MRTLFSAVVLLAAVGGSAHAEVYLEALGGSGGGNFAARCSEDKSLAGFDLRVGDDVDAIRPLCIDAAGPRAGQIILSGVSTCETDSAD